MKLAELAFPNQTLVAEALVAILGISFEANFLFHYLCFETRI